MRVLQIIDIGYEAGGAEKIARIVRDRLQQQDHDVFILSTDKNADGRELFADATTRAVHGGAASRLLRYFWNRETFRTVRNVIEQFDPDIVHLHTIGEFSPSVIWALGSRPAILTVHGPEEFTLKLLPWLLPASDYSHGSYQWDELRLVGKLRYAYLRCVQRPAYLLAMKRLRLVTVPSKFMAQTVAADFPHTPVTVLYPGTILPQDISAPRSARPTLLFVGRLEAVKGIDYLIRAFARVYRGHPESRLRIVGDGRQREALEDLVSKLGLGDAVVFAGWMKATQIGREYANASVVVIPSVGPEALGLVGIDALSYGRPIIGSNSGGIPELIDPDVTGAVVTPRDEIGLAQAIESFLFDKQKLASAAEASAVKARDFYVDSFIEKQLGLYHQVIAESANVTIWYTSMSVRTGRLTGKRSRCGERDL